MNRDELGGRAGYDETFCLDEEENKESQSRRDVGRGLSSHRASSSLAMPWFVAKTERTTGCWMEIIRMHCFGEAIVRLMEKSECVLPPLFLSVTVGQYLLHAEVLANWSEENCLVILMGLSFSMAKISWVFFPIAILCLRTVLSVDEIQCVVILIPYYLETTIIPTICVSLHSPLNYLNQTRQVFLVLSFLIHLSWLTGDLFSFRCKNSEQWTTYAMEIIRSNHVSPSCALSSFLIFARSER